MQHAWSLADAGLKLDYAPQPFGLELRSLQVFLEPATVSAATRLEGSNATFILTYLANLISAASTATPYSMVTAAGPPYTPAEMSDDEILVNRWLADDLHVVAGDKIDLTYFDPQSGARLVEQTNSFRVRNIVPMEAP